MERFLLIALSCILVLPLITSISIQLSQHLSDHRQKSHEILKDGSGAKLSDYKSTTGTTGHSEADGWKCEAIDACSDLLGYEAIKALHTQLDDDANGSIDVAESDDFLRDELNYENGYERQNAFHRNDKFISVDELWESWKSSEVHNWTTDELLEWLVTSVDLPQYGQLFENKHIDGTYLPRMAINSHNFLNSMGIKDLIHKQKLALKAMDAVLFGPPRHRNYLKDVILIMCLVIALGGCWFALVQHKYSQSHLRKMMRDMESLQNAEDALKDLQKELDKAKQEQEIVSIEKQNLEKRLHDEMLTIKHDIVLNEGVDSDVHHRIQELESELHIVQQELEQAEKALQSRSWAPPPELQRWMQLTHELELKHYNHKKQAAERQLYAAKEGCEKLRRKRSSIMEAFRIAHGGNIDDIDHQILQAKSALCEVTNDLQERLYRWKKIEALCGFSVVLNPGLAYLEASLASKTSGLRVSPPPSYSKLNADNNGAADDGGVLTEEEVDEELEDEEVSLEPVNHQQQQASFDLVREGLASKPIKPSRKIQQQSKSMSSQELPLVQVEAIRPRLIHADSCQDMTQRKISQTTKNSTSLSASMHRGISSPVLDEEGNSTDSTLDGESIRQSKKKSSFLTHFKKSKRSKET